MKAIDGLLLFMSIAIRNAWRSRRRSAITALSVCVGTLTLILLWGYILMMDRGLRASTMEKETGYFQLAEKGYFADDALSLEHSLDGSEAAGIEEFLYGIPEVTAVTKRLQIVGMIGTPKRSAVFSGICDSTDSLVSMVPTILEGAQISSEDPEGIVVGKRLAEKLELRVGDPVLLFVSSDTGAPEAVAAVVRGIYKGLLAEQEGMIVYIPIETAWSLMLEERTQRYIGFLDDPRELDAVMERIRAYIRDAKPGLEARTWDELALMYEQIVAMFSSFVAIAALIIFMVIIFGISNTMYMAIHDRTREIGTMRALGKPRRYIVSIFFAEGLFIGFAGAILGTVAALTAMPIVNAMKLTLPPGPGQTDRIPLMFASDAGIVFLAMAVSVASAALASILPALKASRQNIAESLRFS